MTPDIADDVIVRQVRVGRATGSGPEQKRRYHLNRLRPVAAVEQTGRLLVALKRLDPYLVISLVTEAESRPAYNVLVYGNYEKFGFEKRPINAPGMQLTYNHLK
jgi:hypothetical protein